MSRYHHRVQVHDRHGNQTELTLIADEAGSHLQILSGGIILSFSFRELAAIANLFDDAVTATKPAAEGGGS